ncbi:polysaccharide export protein [Roseomonas stagni]|uniref:Polysaccharide export protein n=1 Tax=Falsiroseomonas algicola TaxID=2716930 RepID=A0A6M1LXL0_9PROT|nr:polysaccharide biosynthesis/export family protein [Falsiroseomonas algicola]NGM24214.1 polysaccharide export protein [Falsiroseomonas algicola]
MNGALRLTLLALLAGCLSACSASGPLPATAAPQTLPALNDGYVLEAGNRLRVVVFGQESLSGEFNVDNAGNLALPLAGSVQAAGISANVLAARIATRLRQENYLQNPNVSVEVLSFRPFYVLGEVKQPGEFPYLSGVTVLSAIARAGGYDYRARQGEVLLIRQTAGRLEEFRATELTPLLPGDIVRVQERRF